MPTIDNQALSQEWKTLQNNYEQYEKSALLIKLTGVVLYTFGRVLTPSAFLVTFIVLILWMQEGIFRTYQSRLGTRILRIEASLKQGTPAEGAAFQLHSEWSASRKGVVGLIGEYAASAARPTVAFPYAVLLLIEIALCLIAVK